MKTVLITGATGFIGSRLVKELIAQGFTVKATARVPQSQTEEELGTTLIPLDLLEPQTPPSYDLSADCLIHCATANDIVSKNPTEGFRLSVEGTWNALTLAKQFAIPQAIYFSTFQVYGTELTGTINESSPVQCKNAYGLNHWFGEEVCRLHASQLGMDIAVVRPSNVYGAPCTASVKRDSLVPICFVRDAMTKGVIRLNSSGRQSRNFISTQECASACIHVIKDFPTGFSILNLCSAYNATIIDIAQLTADIHKKRFGTTLTIETTTNDPAATNVFVADSALRSLWKTAAESRHSMRNAIDTLYEQL
jgi:nucleoside-diphosphate-sugar epimerase